MSGMNVFGTNAAANTDPQKINSQIALSKLDLNMGGNAVFDKVTFDSLLTNLKAAPVERRQSEHEDYHAEQTKRNKEYSGKSNEIDNRSEDHRAEESHRASEKSDRHIETVSHKEAYRDETVKKNSDHSDVKAELEVNESTVDSALTNKGTELTDEANHKESDENNASKISAVLFDIANSKAAELSAEIETVEGGEAALTEGDKESGEGLKNGALLYDALHGKSTEVVDTNTSNGKEGAGQAGVKAGDILKGLIDAKIAEASKTQVDTAVKSENPEEVKPVEVKAESVKAENGLKLGELLNKSAGIEKELMTAMAKTDNAEGEEPDTEIDELIKNLDKNTPADKKADIKQAQIKETRIQDFMNQKDIQEGNNAKATVSKDLPGMVENLIRESGVKPNTNATVKTAGENSETNNISATNDVSAKSSSSKVNIVSPTGSSAKPSGFADVVNKIVYAVKGDTKLGVTVEHKDLGQLNIKLSLEKGVVNVHINTADKVARDFVESNIQQIVDSLSKNGVSVGGFSVGLKNHQNKEGFTNSNSNKRDKAFSIEGMEKHQYMRSTANVYGNQGRVSVFA